MKELRYKISTNTVSMSLIKGHPSTWANFDYARECDKVWFHSDQLYFVDILDRYKNWAKLYIYMPDGTFRSGWQSLDYVELHYTNDVFDGRFNNEANR